MLKFIFIQGTVILVSLILAIYGVKEVLLLTGIYGVLFYSYLAYKEMKSGEYIISPLIIYLILSIFYIGIASFWTYLCLITKSFFILKLGYVDVSENVLYTMPLCLLGVLAFYTGYKLTDTKRMKYVIKAKIKKLPNFKMPLLSWLILIAIASLIREMPNWGVPVDRLGAIYKFISVIPILGAFFILTSHGKYKNGIFYILPSKSRIFWATLVVLYEIFFHALNTGMRFPLIFTLLMFLFGVVLQNEIYIRQKYITSLKFKSMLKIGLLITLLSAFLIFVFIPFGKEISRGGKFPEWKDFKENVFDIQKSFPTQGIWALPSRVAISSIRAIGAVLYLRKNVEPERKVHKNFLIGLVPRVLWPDKPYVTQGAWFSTVLHIGKGTTEKTATTSTGITAIGELYWSYGLWGVILGMMLIGFLYSLTFKIFYHNFPLHPIRMWAVGLLLIKILLWLEGEATSIFIFFVHCWVVFFPLGCFNFLKRQYKQYKN